MPLMCTHAINTIFRDRKCRDCGSINFTKILTSQSNGECHVNSEWPRRPKDVVELQTMVTVSRLNIRENSKRGMQSKK